MNTGPAPLRRGRICLLATLIGWGLSTVSVAEEGGEGAATNETAAAAGHEGMEFPEKSDDGGSVLPEMVVEAENQVIQEALRSVPLREPTAAEIDSVYSPMDTSVLSVSPVSGIRPHLNNLVDLASSLTPHYWRPEMSRNPVVTFYADQFPGNDITDWELKLVNFRGAPVRTFAGTGKPPARLTWDGRDDHGRILEVGFPLSYVVTVTDRGSNAYSYNGSSFRITALDYVESDARIVAITGGRIFERGRAEITEGGRGVLDKASDAMAEHPLSAVTMTVTASTTALGEARAEVIAEHLAEQLIIPVKEIRRVVNEEPEAAVELDGKVTLTIHNAR
jgi:hypothetical protein